MKVYDGSQTEQESVGQPERKKVGIAEYAVTTDEAVLTTSGLGSCIGVALYDPDSNTAGLVHVMLPRHDEGEGARAKFADTGVEVLLEEMERAGAQRRSMEAKIAGGSDMLDFSENGSSIGSRNAAIVRETLAANDVPILGEDVGGDYGRSLRLKAATGDLIVKSASQGTATL
ncbi:MULTISPECIES: chemotaxis protein CheD [Halomicrobium]|uniref:Probable chemoreceptor glutamine deamidase CheD n=2 Tax=Halomicrobium mukohataei TaxID=57705 RepID=C7NX07_HALMD|nr:MULTISPECIES: chemotaxis protein CheD [Halomicrobium]ACV46372.1 CheD [Halomicrobium mukohataei DSM 12286]QCD64925.1 chemotaxis protein CheD [Halomicrobium mukohataei]QFR19731.1 chemotaxis protein CheD [Halomicrobium sp. ZPS1]